MAKKQQAASIPILIKVKPGTAAEKALSFTLPEKMIGKSTSIETIVRYALGLNEEDGIKRSEMRVKDRITTEMKGKYGISVNGTAVDGGNSIDQYLINDKTPKQQDYRRAEIIVAARQQGASTLEYL